MTEEEIQTPENNNVQQQNTVQPEAAPQTQPTVQAVNPVQRNLLHVVFLILLLLPVNYIVYRSLRSSAQAGDSGNAASADGIANLQRTTKESPSYDSFLALGVALYNEHRFQEAIDAWQGGLQFKPNSETLYSNMGAAYNCLSNWKAGKENCEKALSINPNFSLAQNNLKWAMQELAKAGTPAGTPATGPAPVPSPQSGADFNSLLNQGLAYYNAKNFPEAINVWKKALVINPNSEIVYSNMGAAYGCMNMWREQVAACEKALAINPNYQLAANNLAWGKSELKKRGLNP